MKALKSAGLTLCLLVSLSVLAKPQFGTARLFNDGWKFQLSDKAEQDDPAFNDARWKFVALPHDWSVQQPLSPDRASCQGYLPGGVGWYRKTFVAMQSEKTFIYFEGVYNHSEVFLNGHSLGKRPNGYVSFLYDLTPFLKPGSSNVLAVRVDHSEDVDSRWYTGSGIYRNVWLVTSESVHLNLWGVYFKTRQVTDKKADVSVESSISNEQEQAAILSVSNEIVDPVTGKVVAGSKKQIRIEGKASGSVEQSLTVLSPKRWSVEQPRLYTVRTVVSDKNGRVLDRNEQQMGIRSLTFDPDRGFALNGKWMKVKGICMHHDAGVLGSAVPRDVWKRRLLTLKDMGCNAVRMSHNPQSPDVYELCDEIGLLVMDEAFDEWEFAKKKWVSGWNNGTPKFQGAFSFFEEWSDRDLSDMVRRDRNHASVFLWSIGNEVDYPNDPYSHPVLDGSTINQPVQGGYLPDHPKAERLGAIAKRLAAVVRSLDTSRPVTAALAGVVMSNHTDYPFALDVAGYNYTEDRYALDHKTYPKRVIYGSENGHSMESWKVVRDSNYIFGQFIWTGLDYLGESGSWPSRGFYTGFVDFGGFLKPRGHFRQALWSSKPVAYIGTYPASRNRRQNGLSTDAWPIWNYNEGQLVRVVCYTNAAQAKLLLNGKEVGSTKQYNDTTGIIYWDIPYEAGTLEVVGMDKAGKTVSGYALQTSGRPEALTVATDLSVLDKHQGLAQIVVQVVDANGVPVLLSEDEVACTIEGPARLLGLEASNNSDMGDYTDNKQRVFHGRLIAYVQATGTEGTATVRFSAPWLKPVSTTLTITNGQN